MRNLILRSAALCCASFLSMTLVGCSGADQPEADQAEPTLTAEAQAELTRAHVPPSEAAGNSEARPGRRGRGDGAPRRRPGRGGDGHGGNDGEGCGGSGGDGGVVCALFVEVSDGVCSRPADDPCISQDPDCVASGQSCEAGGQIFPDGSEVPSGDSCNTCSCGNGNVNCTRIGCEEVACAEFIEESDGVCSRFPLDPCISQDPDCVAGGQSCEAGGQSFPDGSEVPSGDSCNTCSCGNGNVNCTRIGCEEVVCALFIEESDGVCSRFPLDPCKSQDPDCVTEGQACEVAGQVFPDGSGVPSGDSCNSCGCNDGSVVCTLALCEEVACLLFIEESDGVCSRFPLDPCKSQDPDCAIDG